MKPFQAKCRGCGKVLSSVSMNGIVQALRRHAKHHPAKDFPLKYQMLRSHGRAVRRKR